MRRLIIISSSGLTLLFLVVLAWSVWTVVRAPFVMQTAGLPWAHEQQQDEERKAKAAAEARRLPEERMRLAASDKAADETEARRKVEEQQQFAPPAVAPEGATPMSRPPSRAHRFHLPWRSHLVRSHLPW